jgi:cytoskeletal protein CcmA (bactofilin family)
VFGKKVRFGASARVEGDTFHETIAIEDGAYYEGSIRRQSNVSDTPNTAANDKLAKSN